MHGLIRLLVFHLEDLKAVESEDGSETVGECLILGGVGEKNFSGLHRPSPEQESSPFF